MGNDISEVMTLVNDTETRHLYYWRRPYGTKNCQLTSRWDILHEKESHYLQVDFRTGPITIDMIPEEFQGMAKQFLSISPTAKVASFQFKVR